MGDLFKFFVTFAITMAVTMIIWMNANPDAFMGPIFISPIIGIIAGAMAVAKSNDERNENQKDIEQTIQGYYKKIGDNECSIYFFENPQRAKIIAFTTNDSNTCLLNNIKPTDSVRIGGCIIVIDNENQKLLIVKSKKLNIEHIVIPYDNFIKFDIFENAQEVYSRSASRTIAGSVLGGAIGGGAGAVVGGLSGNTKKEVEWVDIKIRLIFEGMPMSSYSIETSTYGGHYTDEERVMKLRDMLVRVANFNEKQNASKVQAVKAEEDNRDVITSIERLAVLKEKGILTEQEFNEQKKKLLS